MAVPRDIDPGVGSIDGVTLLDIDDLRAFAARRGRSPARGRGGPRDHRRRSDPLRRRRPRPHDVAASRRAPRPRRRAFGRPRCSATRPSSATSVTASGPAIDALTKGIVAKLCTSRPCGSRTWRARPAASGSPKRSATCSTSNREAAGGDPLERALARWQTEHVAALLRASDPSIVVEMVLVETAGDRNRTAPLHELGGQGIFSAEVQEALLDGRADIAVHSAKDLPSRTADRLVLAAVPFRGDARDALVGRPLDALQPAPLSRPARCGAGPSSWPSTRSPLHRSPRQHPDPPRRRCPTVGAIVMAYAALERLGLAGLAAEFSDPDGMVPQVGQGALAVECREGDPSADVVRGDRARSEPLVRRRRARRFWPSSGAVATFRSAPTPRSMRVDSSPSSDSSHRSTAARSCAARPAALIRAKWARGWRPMC